MRDSARVLEDLCIALREVGTGNNATLSERIERVITLDRELEKRGVSVVPRLGQLTHETGWLMPELLQECRAFPAVVPHVRELDGIRRDLRCPYCGRVERPENDVILCACDGCLQRMIESCRTLQPINGTVLFRTYNEDWRCRHAGADTVLVAMDGGDEGFLGPGRCEVCLIEILTGRGGTTSAA